jgi:hypothetical protein
MSQIKILQSPFPGVPQLGTSIFLAGGGEDLVCNNLQSESEAGRDVGENWFRLV